MQVYVKSLQRLTPKLNLQETEEIELETLKEKDEPFDIAAAFKVDFEEDDAPEESPGKSKKTDEALGSPSKKLTGTEATITKDPLAKPSTFQIAPTKDALVDPVPIPEGVEKDISVKSGSRRSCLNPDKPAAVPSAENAQGSDARASPLNEALSTGKPGSTDQQKIGSEAIKDLAADASQKDEAAKEVDLEAEQRLREEEAKRAAVYEKLLTIKPTLRTLKKWHVSTLDNHYELCLHPEPLFPKHCVLTKNGRIKYDAPLLKYKAYEEKVDKRVRISDFSDIHRLRVDSWSEKVRVEELANIEYSTLNSRFLDLKHLFTVHDLGIMDGLLKQLDCFVFYRVLPDGAKDHKSLMNQVVHLVPKQDLLDEVNSCMKGFIQVDELDLIRRLSDWTEVPYPPDVVSGIRTPTGLVRDKTIEDHHQRLLEVKRAREEKLRKIEEKRLRREARERALQEKLEAERKAAEEAATREREALKNPAKAAALRIEKEKAAAAAAAAEQERLEKEKQPAESEPTEPVEGAAPVLDPEAADVEQQELIESAIPPAEEGFQFVNKFADSFFRFSRIRITLQRTGKFLTGSTEGQREKPQKPSRRPWSIWCSH